MVQVIARYWNGLWGNWTRRWLWLEYLGDGWYQVRWRGDWDGVDRTLRVNDSFAAITELGRIAETDPLGEWREIPVDP